MEQLEADPGGEEAHQEDPESRQPRHGTLLEDLQSSGGGAGVRPGLEEGESTLQLQKNRGRGPRLPSGYQMDNPLPHL